MSDANRGFQVVAKEPAAPAPAFPHVPLSYYHVAPASCRERENWTFITRLDTTAAWHQARAALARGHIASLMGEGEDASAEGVYSPQQAGISLLVPEPDVARALTILDAVKNGHDWCPKCGSTHLQVLPLPWWWVIWSILFLGVAPFSPPRFECRRCAHRWE
jgi:hypothetical protein